MSNERITENSNQIIVDFGNKVKKHDEQFNTITDENNSNFETDKIINVNYPPAESGLPGAIGDGITDDTIAINNIIKWGISQGIYNFKFPNKKYKIYQLTDTFTTPGDDGTVHPDFLSTGDVNIPAETVYQMPVCLKLPNYVKLISDYGTVFVGEWVESEENVNINQPICVSFDRDTTEGFVYNSLENITFEKYFIPVIGKGIWTTSHMKNVTFKNCAISAILQGTDDSLFENIYVENCYTSIVIGGWWLNRNKSYSANYMSPYPARDVFFTGWSDATKIEGIRTQMLQPFSNIVNLIDEFFNTYFYKEKNSQTYPTGRCAKGTPSSRPATFLPYEGITGRVITVLNRYGRTIQNFNINKVKGGNMGWRGAIYLQGSTYYCTGENLYLERIGYIDALADNYKDTNNLFGVGCADIYNNSGNYYAIKGINFNQFSINLVNQASNLRIADNTAVYSYDGLISSRDEGANYGTQLWKVLQMYLKHSNGQRTTYYDFGIEKAMFGVPIELNAQDDMLKLKLIDFKPEFRIGNTVQTFTTSRGRANKIGNMVFFKIMFTTTNYTYDGNDGDSITITNLPFTSAGDNMNHISIDTYISGVTDHIYGRIGSNSSTILLGKDLAMNTKLTGVDMKSANGTVNVNITGWFMTS